MPSISEIRTYIKNRPGISMKELCIHFKISESLLDGMIMKLVERGDVVEFEPPKCTGSCCCGNGPRKAFKYVKNG